MAENNAPQNMQDDELSVDELDEVAGGDTTIIINSAAGCGGGSSSSSASKPAE